MPSPMRLDSSLVAAVDSARLLDNSSHENPFQQVAIVNHRRRKDLVFQLPKWAEVILEDIPPDSQ